MLTTKNTSFYMDLTGVLAKNFKKITWSAEVLKIEAANPYVIGFLSNNTIEMRNIFSPNKILHSKKMFGREQYQLVTACVLPNLLTGKGLDDFYSVYRSNQIQTGGTDQLEIKYKLIKLTQQKPEDQLNKWHALKLFSICLKFIDFL